MLQVGEAWYDVRPPELDGAGSDVDLSLLRSPSLDGSRIICGTGYGLIRLVRGIGRFVGWTQAAALLHEARI